ncbi:MAG TPA: hypothetical protein VEY05_08955 [Beijerinckiaceae bacterium]|nr:hypothetical protein [Beijerinckiaceae bacterium]
MRFSDFDGLTFDMIGTLIDFESGAPPDFLATSLQDLLRQLLAELSA